MKIGLNNLVYRQTEQSEYTHFDGELEDLLPLIEDLFDKAKPGYRDGVLIIPMNQEGFFSEVYVLQLQAGDRLIEEYSSRSEGEEFRKTMRLARCRYSITQIEHAVWALSNHKEDEYETPEKAKITKKYRTILEESTHKEKISCKAVDVILYRKDVLLESDENSTDADWEVISINGRPALEEIPIHPD